MILGVIRRLKSERLGLAMIVAPVTVIIVIMTLLFRYESSKQLDELRAAGAGVVQLMAGFSLAQLSSFDDLRGPLKILRELQADNVFAYALVVDAGGQVKNAVTAPGVRVPDIEFPRQATNWADSRSVILSEDETAIEFSAPVIESGAVVGTLRIGYFEPVVGVSLSQVPFLGMLALPIFLLAPLFYFLLRREIRPIHTANQEIAELISDGRLQTFNIEATGEFRDFIGRFNQFIEAAREKIEVLEIDNNELVTSQKLLSYRKLRIEAVLKAVPDAIVVLGEDGRVTYANEKVETVLGVLPADILHRPPSEWCIHPDAMQFMARFEVSETSKYFSDTIRISDVKAARRKLSMKAFPLFAPQSPDTIFGRLIIISDSTRDLIAEESRANFVAHVAHELKSPLNTIGLYAEAFQSEEGQSEEFRIEAYNVIHDETERLAALVDNLLSITKIEMGSLKIEKNRIRLKDLLVDAFNQLSHHGKDKSLEFSLELPPDMSAIAVDKDLLRIAINNLLSNAVKYTSDGGKITLSAIELDDAIEIRIADTGIGISPEDREKIFDKFYRADSEDVRAIGGHGLGLSLAREIVELHRGTLRVESEPGQGSIFVIDLWKDSGLLQQAI